jgi:hypothetical protein
MKKATTAVCAVAMLIVLAQAAWAGDYWNDAVKSDRQGTRQVELPPVNKAVTPTFPSMPKSWEPPAPGSTYVMEGPAGLVECVTTDYRMDGRCNPFTPGQYAAAGRRVWIVKRNDSWWQCSDGRTRNMCQRSATDCTGDPKATDRCYPLKPKFSGWLPPSKPQR